MNAGFDQPDYIGTLVDAAFTDDQFAGRNPFRQTQRDGQIGREGLKISVVDTDQPRLWKSLQYPIEFTLVMGLNEHVHP